MGIAAGPDGNLWFTEYIATRIGQITTGGAIAEFPIPTDHCGPVGIAAGPDGNVWFTETTADQIGRITPAGDVTEFPTPTRGSSPVGITAGPDGNIWFTEPGVTQIGRISTTACAPSATALCLNGRFQVTATWQAASQGTGGQGMAAPLTASTGYFWFFDESNVEVIVKVLDGCESNGNYWVFAAGLTNVGVTLTVTDGQTQLVQTYTNDDGVAFQPIQDTSAFDACP